MTSKINNNFSNLEINVFKSGIKKNKSDLLYIKLPKNSSIAGVFTKSLAASPAVNFCKKNLSKKENRARAILVNSGNANAFTGKIGNNCVQELTSYLSNKLKCPHDEIYTSSTGVIGEFLDPKIIINALKNNNPISKNCWQEAAKAIMTTDTFFKVASTKFTIKNNEFNLIGIAKGSGMIAPNMATMLAYIFTDLNISSTILQKVLISENEKTFNSITVDSDTSTSDTVLLLSTNQKRNKRVTQVSDPLFKRFKYCLNETMMNLAKQIVKDGEGAEKIIEIKVFNAVSNRAAKNIAMSIANSPLVKTAIAGEDANWGRIIMAIGKTNEKIELNKIKIFFGNELVTNRGMRYKNYSETKVSEYLKNKEISISIDLGIGEKNWSVFTCDLTEKYVHINADYRS